MSGAEKVADHPVVQAGARLGYAVSGVMHLVIGLLAVRVAFGDRSTEADQAGAFQTMAVTPLGFALLATTAAGLGLLGVWQAAMVFVRRQTKDRVTAGAKALGYFALTATAVGVLVGGDNSSEQSSKDATATLLSLPWGVALVVVVGLAILGIGVHHVVKGARRTFRRDLTKEPPQGIIGVGVIGYVAKGLALGTMGGLFVQAAIAHDPRKAGGLDGALTALLQLPQGPLVVGLVGAGFAAYAVYSFARARWARI